MQINYRHIADAVSFYQERAYSYIDVPWWVPKHIHDITTPKDVQGTFKIKNEHHLVGSAEQGFLYLWSKNIMRPGRYVAVSPCFRDDKEDFLHQKNFLKVELFDIACLPAEIRLRHTLRDAEKFFNQQLDSWGYKERVEVVELAYQRMYDIKLNGIELGSYGVRECEYGDWVYGTGVAEPRFTRAMRNLHYNFK